MSRVTSESTPGWPECPDAAGQARRPGERRALQMPANSSNCKRRRLPHADALEHVAARGRPPKGAVFPAERLADRPEHRRRRLHQRRRFRQRARGFVEDPLVRALSIRASAVSRKRRVHVFTLASRRRDSITLRHSSWRRRAMATVTDRVVGCADRRRRSRAPPRARGVAPGRRPHDRPGGGRARSAALLARAPIDLCCSTSGCRA